MFQVSDLSTNVIRPGTENSAEHNTPEHSLESVEVNEHLSHKTLQMVVLKYLPIIF